MPEQIEFINYVEGTDKSFELYLLSQMPRGKELEGDDLFGHPDLSTAKLWLRNAIEKMEKLGKYKHASPCKVVEDWNNLHVYIESHSFSGKIRKICGYKTTKTLQHG